MAKSWVEQAFGNHNDAFGESSLDDLEGPLASEPTHPINWDLLSADDAEAEWIVLNRWVNWLRRTDGLPASVVPPFWHRHPELVWDRRRQHRLWNVVLNRVAGSGYVGVHLHQQLRRG
jgi:hypothetical protein